MSDGTWGIEGSSMAYGPTSSAAMGSAATGSVAAGNSLTLKTTGLGKEAFLKMMMAQMQNQDPLNPVQGQDYFMQLAQLTTLEQMWQMNDNMSSMLHQQQLLQAGSMIGHSVAGTSADGTHVSGVVTGVRVSSAQVTLTVGSSELLLSAVDSISS